VGKAGLDFGGLPTVCQKPNMRLVLQAARIMIMSAQHAVTSRLCRLSSHVRAPLHSS
jgi:hypothetical protein